MRPEEYEEMTRNDEDRRIEDRRQEIENEDIPEDVRRIADEQARLSSNRNAEAELLANRILIQQLTEQLQQAREAREAERATRLRLEEHLQQAQSALLHSAKHNRSPTPPEENKPPAKKTREASFPPLPETVWTKVPEVVRNPIRDRSSRPRLQDLKPYNRFSVLFEETYDGDSGEDEGGDRPTQGPHTQAEMIEDAHNASDYGSDVSNDGLDSSESDTPAQLAEKRSKRKTKKLKSERTTLQHDAIIRKRLQTQKGLPKGMALVRREHGLRERSNWFGGMLLPEFYYSALDNAVYTGENARIARELEAQGRRMNLSPPFRLSKDPAPHGFPMNPRELAEVVAYLRQPFHDIRSTRAFEMFWVLQEFRRISSRTHPHLRDVSMREVLHRYTDFFDNEPEWLGLHQAPRGLPPDPRFLDPRMIRNDRPTRGVGIGQPPVDAHVDDWARYIALHGRQGGRNPIIGTCINSYWHVHRGSVRGYLLLRALQPETKAGRLIFARIFVSIVGVPGLYQRLLAEHAATFPDERLEIQRRGRRVPMNYNGYEMDRWDVVVHMALSGVSIAEADNAYLFASMWILFHRGHGDQEFFETLDVEIDASLAARGGYAPPSIDDTWWTPNMEDLERLRVLLEIELSDGRQYNVWSSNWILRYGETPYSPREGRRSIFVGELPPEATEIVTSTSQMRYPASTSEAATTTTTTPDLGVLNLQTSTPEDGQLVDDLRPASNNVAAPHPPTSIGLEYGDIEMESAAPAPQDTEGVTSEDLLDPPLPLDFSEFGDPSQSSSSPTMYAPPDE